MKLTYEKMIDLFKIKEEGDLAKLELENLDNKSSKEKVKALTKKIEEANYAKSIILEENLLLVDFVITTRYSNTQIPYEDLQQEGRLGLIKAIENFEYKRGHKLSTYAHFWIRSYINQAINNYLHLGISGYSLKKLKKITNYEVEFETIKGRLPTYEEIKKHTGLSIEEINELKSLPTVTSLERPISADSELTLQDVIEDHNVLNADQLFEEELKLLKLSEAYESLTPIEQQIINLRYGFKDYIHTLKQVAKIVNLSIERVRQIQMQALIKLREYYQNNEA